MNQFSILATATLAAVTLASPQGFADEPVTGKPDYEIRKASDVQWQPLNPARGDRGPKAGTLWGDQTRDGSSGFLVEFVDGFGSPPHIHNITYRGVVISGLIHNDDPAAEPMWMPPGSFWTQPAGEVHITAAKGERTRAFIEIESGPYLVKPPDESFDRGERPINIDASNLVWLGHHETAWIDEPSAGRPAPKIAFLWGPPSSGQPFGTLVKLPVGASARLQRDTGSLRLVVIAGRLMHRAVGRSEASVLDAGSYVGSTDDASHFLSSSGDDDCVLYIRSEGPFQLGDVELQDGPPVK